MPRAATLEIQGKDVAGLKFFDRLALLVQCGMMMAASVTLPGNRKLHFDQYRMLMLLYLFNPT